MPLNVAVCSRGAIETFAAFCCAWESKEGRGLPGGISVPGKQPSGGGGWAVPGFHSNKLKPERKMRKGNKEDGETMKATSTTTFHTTRSPTDKE